MLRDVTTITKYKRENKSVETKYTVIELQRIMYGLLTEQCSGKLWLKWKTQKENHFWHLLHVTQMRCQWMATQLRKLEQKKHNTFWNFNVLRSDTTRNLFSSVNTKWIALLFALSLAISQSRAIEIHVASMLAVNSFLFLFFRFQIY